MSDPKRYTPTEMVCVKCNQPDADLQMAMQTDQNGEWVKWEDYEKLKAKVYELETEASDLAQDKDQALFRILRLEDDNKQIFEQCNSIFDQQLAVIADLKAENERLRK